MDFDLQQFLDVVCKGIVALSGLGLIGMMTVRITPRGRLKMVDSNPTHLIEPRMQKTATLVFWTFALFVVLAILRGV